MNTFVFNIIVLEWLETMVQKCKNDSRFSHLPFRTPININCHPHEPI